MGCSKDGVALESIPSGPKCRAWISPLGPRGAEVRLEALPSKRSNGERRVREVKLGVEEETRRHDSLTTFI